MATSKLKNVSFKGVVGTVPKTIVDIDQLGFSPEIIKKVTSYTGVKTRRVASREICTSDLCLSATERLMNDLSWEPGSIDALIFVSQTPDYRLPATSCSIHGKLNLGINCATFDVNLGCSGYVYGLWLASTLIACEQCMRIIVLVGDTICKVVSPLDRSTAPLFGDAGSATALEYDKLAPEICFCLGTDGKGRDNLIIPAGGFRSQSSAETVVRFSRGDGNARSEEDLFMNGAEVFNFTIKTVPSLIQTILDLSGVGADDIDYYIFHQANKFMLDHISKKLKLPSHKVLLNLERFGNTSSASIPLVMTSELTTEFTNNTQNVVMAGFGVGYSWGAALAEIGPLKCVALMEV